MPRYVATQYSAGSRWSVKDTKANIKVVVDLSMIEALKLACYLNNRGYAE